MFRLHCCISVLQACVSSFIRLLQVICLDNFFTGCKSNVAHLIGKDNFEMIRHDVTERVLLEVDQIYHLACPASPIHYKCVAVRSCGLHICCGCLFGVLMHLRST